jgi:hypothetical protein
MKIQLGLVTDTKNSYPSSRLRISGNARRIRLEIVGYDEDERAIEVNTRELFAAIKAVIDSEDWDENDG